MSSPVQRLGRYELLEELGRGSMGIVYRARDPKIDRIVALKTIRVVGAGPEQEKEFRERFFREAKAAGKLSHPGIVTVHDVAEDEATHTPFIVMEYIEGRTLDSLLNDPSVPLPAVETTLSLVAKVAEALDYAHAEGVVHRDVKPANIIAMGEGRVKITDFGIAKLPHAEMTVPGQILGTPAYLSPEQLAGGTVDGRSDLFSLGMILYWMLTGQKPFKGDTTGVLLHQLASVEPPPVDQVNPALPATFRAVVHRALAKEPSQRYHRGKEFADDLTDLREGRTPRSQQEALPITAEKTIVPPTASEPPLPAQAPRPQAPASGHTPAAGAASAPTATVPIQLPEIAWNKPIVEPTPSPEKTEAPGSQAPAGAVSPGPSSLTAGEPLPPPDATVESSVAQQKTVVQPAAAPQKTEAPRSPAPAPAVPAPAAPAPAVPAPAVPATAPAVARRPAPASTIAVKPLTSPKTEPAVESVATVRRRGKALNILFAAVLLLILTAAFMQRSELAEIAVTFLQWSGLPKIAPPLEPSVAMHVTSSNTFRAAELFIWADGNIIYYGKLPGMVNTSRFRLRRSNPIVTVLVPVGKRVLRVRVNAPQERYDQTQEVTTEFARQQERRLMIGFDQNTRAMSLTWE